MVRLLVFGIVIGIAYSVVLAQPPGPAEKLGERIDRGLSQIGAELSDAWSDVRRGVEKMGLQGRVFGRLHWDKALDGASLDIAVRNMNTVVLTGSVASEAAKAKAEQLARDTTGVGTVINQLAVAPSAAAP